MAVGGWSSGAGAAQLPLHVHPDFQVDPVPAEAPAPGGGAHPPITVRMGLPEVIELFPGLLQIQRPPGEVAAGIFGEIVRGQQIHAAAQVVGEDLPAGEIVNVKGGANLVQIDRPEAAEMAIKPGGIPVMVEIDGERPRLQGAGAKEGGGTGAQHAGDAAKNLETGQQRDRHRGAVVAAQGPPITKNGPVPCPPDPFGGLGENLGGGEKQTSARCLSSRSRMVRSPAKVICSPTVLMYRYVEVTWRTPSFQAPYNPGGTSK